MQSGEVAYGETPSYDGATPTKSADAQYTYTFNDWSPEITSVTGDATYTATYNQVLNKYTIKFVDEDGAELQSYQVAYGEKPDYSGETPTKAADAQYTYTFSGWSPEIADVTEAAIYTAVYTETVNRYTVKFVNADGTDLQTATTPYGTVPVYSGSEPTKAADAQYTYIFNGWSPEIAEVTGDATYTATYFFTVNTYTVTWADEDGSVLETDENVPYGTMPSYDGETPEKDSTAQFNYTFTGWTPAVVAVTGDVTYTAVYNNGTKTYTVTWVNYDGTVLKTDTDVPYGTMPRYTGEVPTRDDDEKYSYIFDGWLTEMQPVQKNVTYMAKYTSKQTGFRIFVENYTKGKASSSIISGKYYRGTVEFTAEADLACVVAIHNSDDTYKRLYCTENEDGKYQFVVNVTDSDISLTVALKGDVTLDGRINGKDTLYISRVSGKYEPFKNNLEFLVGDVQVNGRINGKDTLYSSRVSGKYETFMWDLAG